MLGFAHSIVSLAKIEGIIFSLLNLNYSLENMNTSIGMALSSNFHMTIMGKSNSIITVVEFRAKQATGSRYMPTDKLYTTYFFIKIDLD